LKKRKEEKKSPMSPTLRAAKVSPSGTLLSRTLHIDPTAGTLTVRSVADPGIAVTYARGEVLGARVATLAEAAATQNGMVSGTIADWPALEIMIQAFRCCCWYCFCFSKYHD
jgi:hypothetical protein